MEQTVKCPICGEPYKKYFVYQAGDQSACPQCRAKAEQKENKLRRRIMYPNRFQRFFEIKDVERSVVFDEVDELKIKEHGGTHYIYSEANDE